MLFFPTVLKFLLPIIQFLKQNAHNICMFFHVGFSFRTVFYVAHLQGSVCYSCSAHISGATRKHLKAVSQELNWKSISKTNTQQRRNPIKNLKLLLFICRWHFWTIGPQIVGSGGGNCINLGQVYDEVNWFCSLKCDEWMEQSVQFSQDRLMVSFQLIRSGSIELHHTHTYTSEISFRKPCENVVVVLLVCHLTFSSGSIIVFNWDK